MVKHSGEVLYAGPGPVVLVESPAPFRSNLIAPHQLPVVWCVSQQGVDMSIDRANHPGMPEDFPVTAPPSNIDQGVPLTC